LPLHQQAGFFQYLGHHTTANLTEDVVEHAQIFQDTGSTQNNTNVYQLGTGILNPLALQDWWLGSSNTEKYNNQTVGPCATCKA
jgi:hypothetical protein